MDNKKQIKEVLDTFSGLSFLKDKQIFTGSLEVMNQDSYQVYIDIASWHTAFPKVYETGERIPRKLDRHIYKEGNCCFTTKALENILLKTKVKTLLQFIERIVIPFFQNNSYYEIHKKYTYGEYSHKDGVLESYQDLLKIKDVQRIITTLLIYDAGIRLTPRHYCYCGNKRTLRKCTHGIHSLGYQKLQQIDKDTLQNNLLLLLLAIDIKTP
jgi:hypothetical protein